MPVDSTHPDYAKYQADHVMIQDITDGERAIKASGEVYIPKLKKQDADEYKAYVQRGSFYNAFTKTVEGLGGAVMRKEPELDGLTPKTTEMLSTIGIEGSDFLVYVQKTVNNILNFGRFGILVDLDDRTQKAYLAAYHPLSIINWRTEIIDGQEKLMLLVLREAVEVENEDEYDIIAEERIRVLRIEEDTGYLLVQVYKKTDTEKAGQDEWIQVEEDILPNAFGKRLDYIPFVFFGAKDNSTSVDKPPLLDLANLNIAHWRLDVDYNHGLHMCGLPTPIAVGFEAKNIGAIGPGTAWVSEDKDANAFMLEFTGQGLTPLKDAINDKEKQMASIGSRMLEEQPNQQEAFQTVQLRQGGDTATLSSLVGLIAAGLEQVLNYVEMRNGKEGKAEVVLNTDFVSSRLGPQDITALLGAVQAGKISMDTFLYNLQQGELLPKGRTIDQEKDLIEAEAPEEFEEDEEDVKLPPGESDVEE